MKVYASARSLCCKGANAARQKLGGSIYQSIFRTESKLLVLPISVTSTRLLSQYKTGRSLVRQRHYHHSSSVGHTFDEAFSETTQIVTSEKKNRPYSLRGRDEIVAFKNLKEFVRAKKTIERSKLRHAMSQYGYSLIQYIGKGNFGRVFLTAQEGTGVLKAIKVLDVSIKQANDWTWLTKEERVQAEEDCARIYSTIKALPSGVVKDRMTKAFDFLRSDLEKEQDPQKRGTRRPVAEREILQRMSNHPFIANLQTSFYEGTDLHLVFAYYSGGTLQALLDENGGVFDSETARFYASELLVALEFLHRNDIAHRDVKPDNCLLTEDGHLALSDFGLATRLKGGLKTFCGTAEYVAPEVLSEKTWSSRYLDWWAFGVTLYQMLAGYTPFGTRQLQDGERVTVSAKEVFLNTLMSPLVFPKDFPEDAKDLCTLILSRSYKDRIKPHDIINHHYFDSVDFDEVRKKIVNPPLKPSIKHVDSAGLPSNISDKKKYVSTDDLDIDILNASNIRGQRKRTRPRLEISFEI